MPKNALCRKEFTNTELNIKVRTSENEDGSISINAEDTAIGFGWTQTKGNKEYVRWETMNQYCRDLGLSQDVGKDDYIPESLFYMLGMKASNKTAQDFQRWLAMEVIPSIRKTGTYSTKKNKESNLKEQEVEARLRNARSREANQWLKMAKMLGIKEYEQICCSKASEILNNGAPLIPLPKAERKTYSAKEIGEKLGISANKVGHIANELNLKTAQYGLSVWDKSKYSNKQVQSFRYYDNVVPVIGEYLEEGQQ